MLLLGRHTDREQHLPGYKVRAAWRTLTSLGPDPEPRLRQFAPDVVHIHNTVPNIGLHWMRSWPGPIVHTLHNFRPICANGLLFRDGRLCTDCPDGKPWSAVEHACYRESRVASTPIALRNTMGVEHNPLLKRADAVVVLSEFARSTFARYDVAADRLHLVPNGVAGVHTGATPMPAEAKWLAVGRLRAEKGFVELLRGWPHVARLDLVGDGPAHDELAELAGSRVHLLGQQPSDELRASMPSYRGLIFTSLAPESAMPLVIVEALEAGIPILVSLTSPHAAQLIADGVAMGIQIQEGRADTAGILAGMDWVAAGGDELRRRCREVFEDRYTQEQWVDRITLVYRGEIEA